METLRTHRVQYWPIFLRHGGAHVGCCGLRPFDPEEDTFELGFHLRPAYWGRGLAVEAGQAVVGYAFATLRARRLFAGHHPANAPSRSVLERLGFRFTGERFYAPTRLYHRSYVLDPPAGAAASPT
jgi:RimJ/RimL family protein N-acetyltransferase